MEHFIFATRIICDLISAMPILEFRGGIPVGILSFGMEPIVAMIYGLIGNLLPIIPILLFFRPISKWIFQFSFINGFMIGFITAQ